MDAYRSQAARATEIERLSDTREKTGVFTGGYAINPVNGARIPLYEWTPVRVDYDDQRRGTQFRPLSPHKAKERDGRDYRADRDQVIAELLSPDIPVPNGILFGMPTGGRPNTSRWFEPGDICEVQWQTSIGGHGRFIGNWRQPMSFELVALR